MTKAAPWIAAVPLVVMVGAIAVPAVAVAAVGVFVAALLRLRWWALVVMAVVALIVVVSLGINPVKRVERVVERTRGTWMSPKADMSTDLNIGKKKRVRKNLKLSMFDRLANRAPSLAKTGLPASIPMGLLLGAIVIAWTQRERTIDPGSNKQRAFRTSKARSQARRKVGKTPETIRGRAVLGPSIGGDLPREWLARKPFGGEFVVVDESNLGRHVVVIGQPGLGKTVTLMQLAHLAAKVYGWRVFFLDGKGDPPTQLEFTATMLHAGIPEEQIGAFPSEPFDGWRATGMLDDGFAQLLNRLLSVVKFTEPYYEDAARAFVSQALMLEGSLPKSSGEFLERLDCLIKASAVEQRREAMGTLLRYRAFFDSFRGKLDGSWSFADKRAAYVLLEGLERGDEAPRLAAYLFECFKHFAARGKGIHERVLLIVDEFPALQGHADVAGLIERLRSFGCSVALTAQSYDGLGDDRDRIISAARCVIAHSSPNAEEIVRLAGTHEAYAMTHQVDYQVGPTGLGSARAEQRFRVDPNLLGSLHEGEVFMISQRRAQLVRVTRRPVTDAAQLRAAEFLRPKTQIERLESCPVTPPEQSEPQRAIDW
ncbi:MAG TPA: hypothetical protein VM784_00565 [Actinomycetota bacterium]|nr:hypothetical protein [Actinomycetota bacterium]